MAKLGFLKRRPVEIALSGGLVTLASLTMSFGDVSTGAVARAIADPDSIIDQRSPGERIDAELEQIKRQRLGAAAFPDPAGARPSQRVLSLARERPEPLALLPAGEAIVADPGIAPLAFAPVAGGVGGVGPGGGFAPGNGLGPAGGGGGSVPPDDGDGDGDGDGVNPAPPGSGPSAVPEPATWAMMIAGFGLVGGMLRRRTRGVGVLVRAPR